MIANHIVPVILTYTFRTDAAFNLLVDRYNTALIQYAQAKNLPLIDLNREMRPTAFTTTATALRISCGRTTRRAALLSGTWAARVAA